MMMNICNSLNSVAFFKPFGLSCCPVGSEMMIGMADAN